MQTMSTSDRFTGLAFPVVRVRYTGNGYAASMRRDNERSYYARASYDHSKSPSEQALSLARECWNKYAEESPPSDDAEPLFVPGDLSADSYSFTVVPAYFFAS